MKEFPTIHVDSPDGLRIGFGLTAGTSRFFVSFWGGEGKSPWGSYMHVQATLTVPQRDYFFAQLAKAVGFHAPRMRPRDSDVVVYPLMRRTKNRVVIHVQRKGTRARLELSVRRATRLCEELAPMLGWELTDV